MCFVLHRYFVSFTRQQHCDDKIVHNRSEVCRHQEVLITYMRASVEDCLACVMTHMQANLATRAFNTCRRTYEQTLGVCKAGSAWKLDVNVIWHVRLSSRLLPRLHVVKDSQAISFRRTYGACHGDLYFL